jgi:pimeloyl-ACP methyl ester carboxylesterase
MKNLRKYGKAPFNVVVVHGGPGAAGEMAPVGRGLASTGGVLEPLQSATSIKGQVEELKNVIEQSGDLPVNLIGYSWGAWLSYLAAAYHPLFVKKLILVGSGPFEEKYATSIQETRLNRLSEEEREEVKNLIEMLENPSSKDRITAFARLGELFSKTDAYDPVNLVTEMVEIRPDIFRSVWKEAAELRRNNNLLELAKDVKCPVVAIHGDYDPHPSEGVQKPLMASINNFRFILLKNCGHKPWIERQAREKFYKILKEELI